MPVVAQRDRGGEFSSGGLGLLHNYATLLHFELVLLHFDPALLHCCAE